jgi:hypothetical protein
MRFLRSLLVLLAGSVLVAAAYWALLNVPESNVPALLLSAALAVLIVVGAGATIALATAAADSDFAQPFARCVRALPFFLLGAGIFAALWTATTWFDGWWASHRGEADALAIRYTGFTRTAGIHAVIAWISWFIRWAIGLSAVVALAVAGTVQRDRAAGAGVRLAIRAMPLLAATAAVLLISQGLWRVAPWRPDSLPPTSAEVYFAAAKLGVLYLAALIVATGVLAVYRREAERLP